MIELRHEVPDVLLALLLIIDVGGRAVPPYDRPVRVQQRRRAAQVPGVSFADDKQAMLHFIGQASFAGAKPRFRGRPPIIGMNDPFPIRPARCSIPLATRAHVLDAAIGACGPDQLRQAVGQEPEMLFAASQLLLGAPLLLGSQGDKLRRSGQGVRQAVKLANAGWRRGDRRASEDVPRLRFQLSHLSRQRAAIQIGQHEAARYRERGQNRGEEKRARANSQPVCVGGDANRPAAAHGRVGRNDLLSADRTCA